jgi:hypothetical protein
VVVVGTRKLKSDAALDADEKSGICVRRMLMMLVNRKKEHCHHSFARHTGVLILPETQEERGSGFFQQSKGFTGTTDSIRLL